MRPLTFIAIFALASSSACAVEETAACFPLDHAENAPRRARTGESDQGRTLQGEQEQGRPLQGEKEQGRTVQGAEDRGGGLALSQLGGVRLELVDGGATVALSAGRLVAGDRTRSSDTLEAIATTASGERIPLSLTRVLDPDGDERIAIVANGWTVCAAGNDGMFVPGAWDETGAHVAERGTLTYACMDGVIAKCVDWGYAPWTVGSELHATCTRLARADYCGDGRSWTMNGTLIDVYDARGVLEPLHDPEFSFEAAWAEHGAVCVHATRYDIVDAAGQSVVPECLATLPECTSLDEAIELGATMANESAHTPIDVCG